jgi:site-specific DNA-cytosine methylase
MWILPKQLHISAYAQDTKELGLDLEAFCQTCEKSLTWRGKDSVSRTWLQRWKRENWMQHLSSRMLKPSLTESFVEKWTILSGGFPCQPFSAAGKRQATEDPRHLFPYIADGIRECQPRIVFLENVQGILSCKTADGEPVLQYVLRELEGMGYRATAGIFSAEEVGAPHQRKRVFIMGYSSSNERRDICRQQSEQEQSSRRGVSNTGTELVNPNSNGHSEHSETQKEESIWGSEATTMSRSSELANNDSPGGGLPPNSQSKSKSRKQHAGHPLETAVMREPQNWPTATARDWKGCGNAITRKDGKHRIDNLEAVIKYGHPDRVNPNTNGKSQESWPTPRANKVHPEITEQNREHLANRKKANLEEDIAGHCGKATGKLNPNWVEHLMGLPAGWTDLGSWETE